MVAHGRKTGAERTATARRRAPDLALDLDDLFGTTPSGADAGAGTRTRGASSVGPETRVCDMPGCDRPGEYRAPRDRSLSSYFHFCLEHVRAYNKAWNYCAGMSEDEIEAHVRTSTMWDRPTWRVAGGGARSPSAAGGGSRRPDPERIVDPLGLFAAARQAEARRAREAAAPFPRDSKEMRALQDLDLDWPVSRAELKARYRLLVKRFHPDANGGDKHAEERFKTVSESYRILLAVVES